MVIELEDPLAPEAAPDQPLQAVITVLGFRFRQGGLRRAQEAFERTPDLFVSRSVPFARGDLNLRI
jgi:hypothetical protein